MKLQPILIALITLAHSLLSAEEVKWDDLDLNVDRAVQSTETHYGFFIVRNVQGKEVLDRTGERITLKKRGLDKKGNIILSDSYAMVSRTFKHNSRCRKNRYLLPIEMISTVTRHGKLLTKKRSKYVDGQLETDGEGKKETVPYPANTLTLTTLMRFMPQMPRNVGTVIRLPTFGHTLASPRIQTATEEEPIKLEYMGLATVQHRSKPTKAHKYVLTSGKHSPPFSFFVSPENGLIRVGLPGDEIMTPLTPKELKDLLADNAARIQAMTR
jgi:hypothetical protein